MVLKITFLIHIVIGAIFGIGLYIIPEMFLGLFTMGFLDPSTRVLGAAILAGTAVGMFKNLERACEGMVTIRKEFNPNPENYEVYGRTYERYVKIYNDLLGTFAVEED